MQTSSWPVAPEEQREQDLVWAIKRGDLPGVQAAVKSGASVKEPIKYVYGYKDKIPFEIAYKANQFPIAEFLLSKGALDGQALRESLSRAATEDLDIPKVKLLLAHSTKDIADAVYSQIDDEIENNRMFGSKKNQAKEDLLIQIKALFEQRAKQGPVKLSPLVRPVAKSAAAAAQPVAAQPQKNRL